MKRDQVFEFYRRLAEANPAPETELEYANPYTLLVAVALSAQATDVGVNKATRPLFRTVTTPQAMLDLGEDALRDAIKTIGLFNTKAKNVIAARAFWSKNMAARFLTIARRWKSCPASGARPPTSSSTPRSASRRSRSTPTSSASPTALGWPKARTFSRSN